MLSLPVGSVTDALGQVDSVAHRGYCPKGVHQGPVRARDAPPVLVNRITRGVKRGCAPGRSNHGREVTAAEQGVFRPTDTRSVLSALLIAERSPLGANVDDPVADDEATLGADHVAGAVILDEGRAGMLRALHEGRHLHVFRAVPGLEPDVRSTLYVVAMGYGEWGNNRFQFWQLAQGRLSR